LVLLAPFALAAEEKLTAYESKDHGFRLSYPAQLQPAQTAARNSILFLGTQREGDKDPFRESVHVKLESSKPLVGLDLDRAFAAFVRSMEGAGIKITETADARLGGLPAKRVLYTHPLKVPGGGDTGVTVKGVLYFVFRNERAYGLDVRATEQSFDAFMPVAQKVVHSFQWAEGQDSKPAPAK
jgi:hypothetical protein